MARDIAARFAARSKAVVALLRGLPKPLVDGFPVPIANVLDAIASIDRKKTVAAFAKELTFDRDEIEGAAAIKYEWYYGGREAAVYAEGYTFASCKQPYSYGKTDLVKLPGALGVESDVKLDDMMGDLGGLEIGRVLEAQHELCAKVREHYLHVEAETRVPSMSRAERIALPVLFDAYRNLFDLRLYELLHAACAKVDARPGYVFVGTHDRWPILVGTPQR